MRPKIIRLALRKNGGGLETLKALGFYGGGPGFPGAPVFIIENTQSAPFGVVDNYVLTLPSANTLLTSTDVTFLPSEDQYDTTVVFVNIYDGSGTAIEGFQGIPLEQDTILSLDFYLPDVLQDNYQVRYFAVHKVGELFGTQSAETTSFLEVYTIAELPPAITHTEPPPIEEISVAPVASETTEKSVIIPACGFASGNWATAYSMLTGITSVPVNPIGEGGPYTDMQTTVGFYTNPERTILDPTAHPTSTVITLDKTNTQEVSVANFGLYYTRLESRLENSAYGGNFDGLGPIRQDDFFTTFFPIISAPILTKIPNEDYRNWNNSSQLPALNDTSEWAWIDGTGSFVDDQEELEILFYKQPNWRYSSYPVKGTFPAVSEPIIGAGAVLAGVTYDGVPASNGRDGSTAFDNSLNSANSATFTSVVQDGWFSVDLKANYVVTSYLVWARNLEVNNGFPLQFNIEGSTNGTIWVVLDTQDVVVSEILPSSDVPLLEEAISGVISSPASYRHYRFVCKIPSNANYFTCGEIQLIGYGAYESVPLIGAGASLASVLSVTSNKPFSPAFAPTACFEGTFAYLQTGLFDASPPFIITMQLDSQYVITRYKIWPRGSTAYPDAPTDYTFEGSNDGVNWIIVDTQINNPPPFYDEDISTIVDDSFGHLDNSVATPGSYTYYRLNVTHTTGPTRQDRYLNIGELQLIGYKANQEIRPSDGSLSGLYYSSPDYLNILPQANLGAQGIYRVGFRVRHRNGTTTGDWSNVLISGNTLVYTLDPLITSVAVNASLSGTSIILPALGDFTLVNNNWDPEDDVLIINYFPRVFYEIHSNDTFSNLVATGEMGPDPPVVTSLSPGNNYVRYKASYTNYLGGFAGNWLDSTYSDYFIDAANPIFVPIGAPTLSSVPTDVMLNEPNLTFSVPGLSNPQWSWTDTADPFTDNTEELQVLFYKVSAFDAVPADLAAFDYEVSGSYFYGAANYFGFPNASVQGYYRMGFRIRHRLDGNPGSWSNVVLHPDTFVDARAPVLVSVTESATGIDNTIDFGSVLSFQVSEGNYDVVDPLLADNKAPYVEYEVHQTSLFENATYSGKVTNTMPALSVSPGLYYVRYRFRYEHVESSGSFSEYSEYVEDPENPIVVSVVEPDALNLITSLDRYSTDSGASVSESGRIVPSGSNSVYSTTVFPGFVTYATAFTYMIPMRITNPTFSGGDRLKVDFRQSGDPADELYIEIQYNHPNYNLVVMRQGLQTTVALPNFGTSWFNENHVLCIAYNFDEQIGAYLYYSDDGVSVNSVSIPFSFPSSQPCRDPVFEWQGGSPSNLSVRDTVLYPYFVPQSIMDDTASSLILAKSIPIAYVVTTSFVGSVIDVQGTAGAQDMNSSGTTQYTDSSISFITSNTFYSTNIPGISGNQSLSFTVWVKSLSSSPVSQNRQSFFLLGNLSNQQSIGFLRATSTGQFSVFIWGTEWLLDSPLFDQDVWTHVGLVYSDNGIARLYIQGSYVGAFQFPFLALPSSPVLRLGWNGFVNHASNGVQISRFRMFDKAISASDVQIDYDLGRFNVIP
jgi:hypothetical protein